MYDTFSDNNNNNQNNNTSPKTPTFSEHMFPQSDEQPNQMALSPGAEALFEL